MSNNEMAFEVLINDVLINTVSDHTLTPLQNKHILSLVNDFEDGNWRQEKFLNFVFDNIAQTALSSSERDSLVNQNYTTLKESAKNLRLTDNETDDIGEGSEIAEILLYGIMKQYYGGLPVVPKIFYKQNTQDPAKGADSVHIVVNEEENDFSLRFGEAKFYNNIEDARLYPIVISIENALKTSKLKKENSIITGVSDLDSLILNDNLKEEIKSMLSPQESIDNLKSKLNIPILLLHQCPITQRHDSLTQEYKEEIIQYHKERAESYFKKQINRLSTLHKYSEIKFHIILFPVPEKEIIIQNFITQVQAFRL